jgi:hypothetical protein
MSDLPVKENDGNFIGEFEVMDLDKLREKTFLVAVNTGEFDNPKFLCSTLHGPYNFYEMLEEVGSMWTDHQHHAKVHILKKNKKEHAEWLDANTIDYIEANWKDLVVEYLLESPKDKEFTCEAGTVEAKDEDDPRHAKPALKEPEEETV